MVAGASPARPLKPAGEAPATTRSYVTARRALATWQPGNILERRHGRRTPDQSHHSVPFILAMIFATSM